MVSSTVLIIEDDVSTQTMLRTALRRHGLAPVCASDGRSALAILRSEELGAILLDLLLPELSGFDILRHIACTTPGLLPRVIVVTAAHESLWRDCPYIPRTRALLPKPFNINVLEREVPSPPATAAEPVRRAETAPRFAVVSVHVRTKEETAHRPG